MADFKKIFEDLASGRPAKKPVSGNLLKQRAKENEKALKSGFMKMPDYVKKKFNEEEEMKPHKMYKGDKVVVAKNKEEHDKLNKQGYTHDDPKTKKVEEEKKNCGCGQDPCITYGKKQMKEAIDTKPVHDANKALEKNMGLKKTKDSGIVKTKGGYARKRTYTRESTRDNYNPVVAKLRNKEKMKKVGLPAESPLVKEAKKPVVDLDKAGIRDRLKTVKIKYNKPIKTKVTDIGPGGKETVRKDWSEGIERDPESNSFNRTKRKETTVRVGQKKDKKTGKMVDVMGKSSAPQGLPSMKEQQIQLVTNLDFNEGLTNLVSRGLDKVRSSIKNAEKRTGLSVDASKNNKNNPVSGDNIRKRLESQKKRKN